jgi:uncharacterized protein (DUF488 family)
VVTVHTIGHSTLALADFIAALRAHGIGTIADVRRFPASRRHPHFGREALAEALAAEGVGYAWMPELGGRREARPVSRHGAWRNDSFRAFADHMETDEFHAALARLLVRAETQATALMCAEALPWRCHRQLIADALLARGIAVRHVIGSGPAAPHRLTPFAHVEGTDVVYDGGQPELLAASRVLVDRR